MHEFLATGDPQRQAEGAGEPCAMGQPGRQSSAAEAASAAGQRLAVTAAVAAKPLNSPDSHVELMGVVPTDVDESGSERFSFELPSPHHGSVLSPALLSPTARGGGEDDSGAAHWSNQPQQQPQAQDLPRNGTFPLPDAAGPGSDRPLNEDLHSVARGGAAAVGIGFSPRGPARQHNGGQQQTAHIGDLAGSPRSDAGSDAGGGRPPSGQLPSPQQQRQSRPRAIPRLPLGVSLGDGCDSRA